MTEDGADKKRRIEQPKLLIGEGLEEKKVFTKMLHYCGITDVQVDEYKGKDRLCAFLGGLKVATDLKDLHVLAVTRDADNDPVGAAQQLRDAIMQAGFPPTLRVETYVIPAPDRPGMLEDLFLDALKESPVQECIDSFMECVVKATGAKPRPEAKARIHAWLATRERADLRLGDAVQGGEADLTHPAFAGFLNFLRSL